MSTRIVALILVFIMLLQSYQSIIAFNEGETKCVDTYFLAISEKTGSGEAIPVKICLAPSPKLRISIVGAKYDESLFNSFIVASYVLHKICGVGLGEITVYMQSSISAKGASASLAFAIALYSILNSYETRSSSASGVVSVDGFIDSVAGLDKKIDAAINAGIKKIYVPLINGANTTSIVTPIASILDICNRTSDEILLRANKTLLNVANSFFKNVTNYFIGEIAKFVNDMKNASIYKYVEVKEDEIAKAVEKEHWYTAASIAYSTFLTVLKEYLDREEEEALSKYVSLCVNGLHNVSKTLNEIKSIRVEAIPFLIIAINRATLARYYLDLANKSLSPDPLIIANAYGRVVTALQWLVLAKLVNSTSFGRLYSFSDIEKALTSVLNIVSNVIEFDENYSILSLDGIAGMRSSQYSRLPNASKLYVRKSLENLLKIYSAILGENLSLIPYLYYQYSEDVDDNNSIYLLSIATLEAGVTSIVLDVANNILYLSSSQSSYPNRFSDGALYIILYESICLYIISVIVIKKLFDVVK